MSTSTETSASNQDGNPGGSTSTADDAFKPPATQADLDRLIGDRVARERAKYADHDELAAKAKRLDEIEAANKSDLDKEKDRAAAAEADRDKARAEAQRLRVAAKHGISDEDADLFLTGLDEQTLEAQAKRLADREADRKKNGARVPTEGSSPTTGADGMREFTRGLFGSN
jgi:hypothetical protein